MSSLSFWLQIHKQEHEYIVHCFCERWCDWLINWKIINYSYIIRDSLRRYVCMCLSSVNCLARWYEPQKCYNYWLTYSVYDTRINCQAVFMIQLNVKQWFQYRKVNWHTVLTGVHGCTTLRSVCCCCQAIFCDRPSCSKDRNTWTVALLCTQFSSDMPKARRSVSVLCYYNL